MKPNSTALLLTCEHGGHRVPAELASLFEGRGDELRSHRGFDAGALPLARDLARATGAPLLFSTISRLVVDLNRSEHHRALHDASVRALPRSRREALLERHYRPYRRMVEAAIKKALRTHDRILHVSVHSFTPELKGEVRNAEIGLLYDPGREGERRFCHRWRDQLRAARPEWRIRMNYPYRGAADGLTTALRRRHPPARYLGVELEINQSLLDARGRFPHALARELLRSLGVARSA